MLPYLLYGILSEDESTREERGITMNQEMRIINRTAAICHTVMVVVLVIAYAVEVLEGSRTLGYYGIFCLLAVAPVVAEWILYKSNPETDKIKHAIGVGYSSFYIFVLFTTVNDVAFTYAIPMFIVVTLFSDVKFCALVGGGCCVVNVIQAVYHGITLGFAEGEMTTYEIKLALVFLVAIIVCFTTRVTEQINHIKMNTINEEKDTVSTLLNNVMSISGEMSVGIQNVTDQMQELGGAVAETRNAMQEVSSGTNESAVAIQNQLGQTEEIQKHIEKVAEVSESINENMQHAKEDIQNGKHTLDNLLAQVASSEHAGQEVVTDISALEEYMKNMQSIIELITSVASQTSLLALNASIEAARAGEAGRGFAVVATEISNLANQTQSATVNITEVIHNVMEKLSVAVSAVEELMDNNTKQNESVAVVADSFEKIAESTQNADKQGHVLGEVIHDLAAANHVIVESVQTVSAIMQQVSAHSNETYNVSERNTDIVEQVSVLVDNLNRQAQSLHNN